MTINEQQRILEYNYPQFKRILKILDNKAALWIDLFAGAGGVSTGIIREQEADVLFAVNHDPVAIASHQENHPHVIHAIEDIRTLDLTHMKYAVNVIRAYKPDIIICLWASLECIHHSKAKGGQSRDADSRTLAEHLYRYIEVIDPDYIDIENVTEFMSWGPLRIAADKSYEKYSTLRCRKDGSYHFVPFSKKNGKDYLKWKDHICNHYGYEYDYRILNAADFGAYTSRIRYFGQFKKAHLIFSWPQPTHTKNPEHTSLFGKLQKWKSVKDKIRLDHEGTSIFNRKKPLSDNTLERIYAGLLKHISPLNNFYLTKYYGTGDNTQSVMLPAGTITTKDRFALIQTQFIHKYYGGQHNHQHIGRPLGTITTNDKHTIITVIPKHHNQYYLLNPQFNSKGSSVEKPCFTLIARMDKRPPSLIDCKKGNHYPVLKPTDSLIIAKIKAFMYFNSIADIKMRMLLISELKDIQGFPKDYILKGTKTSQKIFIGNSVEVNLAHKYTQARLKAIQTTRQIMKIST